MANRRVPARGCQQDEIAGIAAFDISGQVLVRLSGGPAESPALRIDRQDGSGQQFIEDASRCGRDEVLDCARRDDAALHGGVIHCKRRL